MQSISQKKLIFRFKIFSTIVFVCKFLVILNIMPQFVELGQKTIKVDGAWLGADGVNYLKGFVSLNEVGFFSKDESLSYWPAGYSLFIWLISKISENSALAVLTILQSILFSFAVFYLAKALLNSALMNYSKFIFLAIILNPTLSLSTLVIGYESIVASIFVLILGIIVNYLSSNINLKTTLFSIAGLMSISAFFQPRFLVAGFIALGLIYQFRVDRVKNLKFFIVSILILSFLPTVLILRNSIAIDSYVFSTNLGNTMNIGAGPNAFGGYQKENFGVPCQLTGTPSNQSNQLTKCVLNWYLHHPEQTLKLFINKSILFWSPWLNNGFFNGYPLGTMAHNPWYKIHPLILLSKNSVITELIFSPLGNFVAWLNPIFGVLLIFYGYFIILKSGGKSRLLAHVAVAIILANWVISLFSIGDHRFRLPIMGMSLFLQAIGVKTLLSKGKVPMVEGPPLR